MVHEDPENQVVQTVLQGPEYHYIPEVWEVGQVQQVRQVQCHPLYYYTLEVRRVWQVQHHH